MEEEKSHTNNVKVFPRIRPFCYKEMGKQFYKDTKAKLFKNHPSAIYVESIHSVAALIQSSCNDKNLCFKKTFEFDKIFDARTTQEELYELSVKGEINSSIQNGNNCVILNYGQTGSGKTFTTIGEISSDSIQGILPRIFHTCCEVHKLEIKFSVISIYLEEIYDSYKKKFKKLSIKESIAKGIYIDGLSEELVHSTAEANEQIYRALQNCRIESTSMGRSSSREILIFRLELPNFAKIMVIDLAGTERISSFLATGERLQEASKLHASISALRNIFSTLSEIKPPKHIPFRDSKFTRILQSVLNSRTHLLYFFYPVQIIEQFKEQQEMDDTYNK